MADEIKGKLRARKRTLNILKRVLAKLANKESGLFQEMERNRQQQRLIRQAQEVALRKTKESLSTLVTEEEKEKEPDQSETILEKLLTIDMERLSRGEEDQEVAKILKALADLLK